MLIKFKSEHYYKKTFKYSVSVDNILFPLLKLK